MDVEYCLNNVDPATSDGLRAEFADTNPRGCLRRCGLCDRGAFLVVDGRFRGGEPHATLLAELGRGADGRLAGGNGDG